MAAAIMVFAALAAVRPADPGASILSTPGPTPTYSGTGLPSLDPDDAKFFGVAGTGQQTLSGVKIVLNVGVPAGSTSFSVGIFDGDVSGFWDGGTTSFSYRLFKDPLKNGSTANPLDTITSSQALDDNWFDKSYSTDAAAKAPSGNYFYRLEAGWTLGTPSGSFNNFKVRTSGQVSVRAGQDFGFAAGPQRVPPETELDPFVGSGDPNPGDPNDPNSNSYDGQFTYYFYVPTSLPSITFWDGDNDRAGDTNDPNTPDTDPDGAGPAEAEGANEGAPADGPSPYRSCCNVAPSIYYDILDPESHLFTNSNPSGNTEWEKFVIGNSASDPDVLVTYELRPGLWRYQVHGMDAHNLNVLRSTYEIYSTTDLPLTVSPSPAVVPDHTMRTPAGKTLYYSHVVTNKGTVDDFNLDASSAHGWATAIYADANGNGILDPGEPKITRTGPMAPGQELDILLELVVPPGISGVTDLTTVTASSRSEWAVQGSATDTTILSSPPQADLAPVGPVDEGTPVTLDASGSSDPDEDSLQFRWDFDGDGTWDTDWSPNATVTYTWGDDWSGTVRVEVSDGELTDTAETSLVVANVSPIVTSLVIEIVKPDCRDDDEEHDHDDDDDEERDDDCGCDDEHDDESGDHDGDHEHDDDGCEEEDDEDDCDGENDGGRDEDDEGCGCRDEDDNHDDGDHDDDDEGENCGVTVSFNATAEDPGSDDLTFFWDFGDGTNSSHTYFNDGVGPDPFPSPGPVFPVNVTNETTHVYATSGNFTVTLTVTDDDGGNVTIVRHVLVCVSDEDDDHDDEGDHDDDGCGDDRDEDDDDDDCEDEDDCECGEDDDEECGDDDEHDDDDGDDDHDDDGGDDEDAPRPVSANGGRTLEAPFHPVISDMKGLLATAPRSVLRP